MRSVEYEVNHSNLFINKYRIIKEADDRFVLEKYYGFWFIGKRIREEIFLDGLGRGYYSYKSANEAIDCFNRDFRH